MVDVAPLKTPLYDLHVELGARMAPFAGYLMPIHYAPGILAEHLHTRASAGLFDVCHMGQAQLRGPDYETVARALEAFCPADLLSLAPNRQRYTQLLNAQGGVFDDLMATRNAQAPDELSLVVNASRKREDYALLRAGLPRNVALEAREDRALLALQGPDAVNVLQRLAPHAPLASMPFMSAAEIMIAGFATRLTRSGYTGEDGFEISLAAGASEAFARRLLAEPEVKMIGLGARDSLRLEAGLCLYGHELTEDIDPIEAGLAWSIQKRRRVAGGFPGAARILQALAQGPARRRVGLALEGRAPAREGAEIIDANGAALGIVTSGGYGPSVGAPIAMGMIASAHAAPETSVALMVRGKPLPARVCALPFHPHAYFRGASH